MKTKLRKLLVMPMLTLALVASLLPAAQADILEEEVIYFCTLQAIGSDGSITGIMGFGTKCVPAFNWYCTPKRCTAIVIPEE